MAAGPGVLGTPPEFWLNLQAAHGLTLAKPARTIKRLSRLRVA